MRKLYPGKFGDEIVLGLYPAVDWKYVVTEWDGTKNVVTILKVERNRIQFQYQDGLVHEVSPSHFSDGMNACGVR